MSRAFRLHPDASSMQFDNPFNQRQNYSGTVHALVQLLKQPEDPVGSKKSHEVVDP
jgi:hypothetical protein